jgi:hypothetical protein
VHARGTRRLYAAADQTDDDTALAMSGGALVPGCEAAENIDKAAAHTRSFLLCGPLFSSRPAKRLEGLVFARETGK